MLSYQRVEPEQFFGCLNGEEFYHYPDAPWYWHVLTCIYHAIHGASGLDLHIVKKERTVNTQFIMEYPSITYNHYKHL